MASPPPTWSAPSPPSSPSPSSRRCASSTHPAEGASLINLPGDTLVTFINRGVVPSRSSPAGSAGALSLRNNPNLIVNIEVKGPQPTILATHAQALLAFSKKASTPKHLVLVLHHRDTAPASGGKPVRLLGHVRKLVLQPHFKLTLVDVGLLHPMPMMGGDDPDWVHDSMWEDITTGAWNESEMDDGARRL